MHVIRRTAFKGTGVYDGMRAFLFALVMILVISLPAMAEIFVPDALKHVTGARLKLIDEVSGGCLPQANSVKYAVEVELRRSGFSVDPDSDFEVQITVSGFPIGSLSACAIYLRLEILGWVKPDDSVHDWAKGLSDPLVPMLIYSHAGFTTDDHSIIQNRIEEDVAGYARVFTLVWLRLRQAAE